MTLLLLIISAAFFMWHYDARPETIYTLALWKAGGHTFSLQFCTRQFTLGFGGTFEHDDHLFLMSGPFCLAVQFDRTDRAFPTKEQFAASPAAFA